MERVLSPDEKIKRAEEIYLRRMQNGAQSRVTRVNVASKKKNTYVKKMCIQCILCVVIYTAFYSIKNSNEILPQNITNKVYEILHYDINIEALQGKIDKYVIELNGKTENEKETENEEKILTQENPGVTENIASNEDTASNVIDNEQITEEVKEEQTGEESNSKDQMQIDAEYIKANYSFIKPLEGQITSRFGSRENVEPKYHTGIDIAEDEGTIIYAAMEGTVELVSGEGNYGNHFKITNGEVSTLYAHCKTVYVKEGDYIKQGEQVAEVGETGNATGPHLHFEILRNGEVVNPDLILEF